MANEQPAERASLGGEKRIEEWMRKAANKLRSDYEYWRGQAGIDWETRMAQIIANHSPASKEPEVGRPNKAMSELTAEEFSLMIDMRDAAILYVEQATSSYARQNGEKFYRVGVVSGMLADFAGHMILKDREAHSVRPESPGSC